MVITKVDRPKGRGLKLCDTMISSFAKEKKIPCIKPVSLADSDLISKLDVHQPDFFVVADYGKILPLELLKVPKKLCLCVHPSLLPLYRGATPIGRAVMAGEKMTGTTIFKMDQALDAGPIILQEKTPVESNDDFYSLRVRLAGIGVKLLVRILNSRSWKLQPQKDKLATYAVKLKKEEANIDWQKSAAQIHNLIRAIVDWPTAATTYDKYRLKILSSKLTDLKTDLAPGMIVDIKKEGIYVAAKKGVLLVSRLKPEAKKEMDAYSFACGYRIKAGDKLQ